MKTIGLVAAAAIIAAGGAYAAGGGSDGPRHGRMMERMFDRFDANQDGRIERSEMEAAHGARFKETDADADGVLTADEIKAAVMKRAEARAARMVEHMLSRMDEDGDGSISQAEFDAAPRGGGGRMMARLDADGDGAISREEAQQARRHMGEGRQREGRRHGRHGEESCGGERHVHHYHEHHHYYHGGGHGYGHRHGRDEGRHDGHGWRHGHGSE